MPRRMSKTIWPLPEMQAQDRVLSPPAMRHLWMNHSSPGEPQTPTRHDAGDSQQPPQPRPAHFDSEASGTDATDSPRPTQTCLATPNVIDIGSDVPSSSKSLDQSLIRFSFSSHDESGGGSLRKNVPVRISDWIMEFERQAAEVDATSFQRAPASERRNPSKVPRHSINVTKEGSPTLGKAFSPPLKPRQRLYTDSLGTPVHLETPECPGLSPGSSKDPSEVSDAGQQLNLRYKRRSSSASTQTEGPNITGRRRSVRASSIPDSQYELQKKIINAFQQTRTSHGQSQEFLPEGDLFKLINPLSVSQELRHSLGQTYPLASIDGFTKKVCGETQIHWDGRKKIRTYRKIFALLVLVGATASTPIFLDQEVSDLNLPLHPVPEKYDDDLGASESDDQFYFLEELNWAPIQIRTFQDYQWKMLAPFFAKGKHGDVMHYPLLERHILPFLLPSDAERQAEKAGGFAKVSMVRIHDAHHNFHEQGQHNRAFAVKQQLYAENRDVFKREIAVLKKFSGDGRGHKHIISLLATFEQFGKLNLLFHRAEGDLFTYWNHVQTSPNLTSKNIKWVAEQCEGLVEALLRVHKHLTFTKKTDDSLDGLSRTSTASPGVEPLERSHTVPSKKVMFSAGSTGQQNDTLVRSVSHSTSGLTKLISGHEGTPVKQYGRHGDINPGNILWFRDNDSTEAALGGTLKIADFGQAEFNSLKSRTAPRDVANTLTYRPPECDRLVRDQKPLIRQRYDIWCLGCVFLEFLTWVIGGEQLQLEFASARLTPDLLENDLPTDTFFQVRRNIETDCYEVTVKPEVTQGIKQLHEHANCSEFFHQFLNLVQDDMLVVDSSKRSECHVVWKALRTMLRRCRTDDDYAVLGRPWPNTPTPTPQIMEVKAEKANNDMEPAEPGSDVAPKAAQMTQPQRKEGKRAKGKNRRNGRVTPKPDHARR